MARSHAEMADMLTDRGPFSDPRDGRVLRQIRLAFWSYAGFWGIGSPKARRRKSRRATWCRSHTRANTTVARSGAGKWPIRSR